MPKVKSQKFPKKPLKKMKWSTISKVLFVVFGIISASGVFFEIFVNSNRTILPNLRLPFINRSVATTYEMEFAMNVVRAMHDYYAATQSEIDENSETVEYMTDLLNQTKYLNSGNGFIEAYLNHTNEIVGLTALGMNTGSNAVIKANTDFVELLRKEELNNQTKRSEIEYQVAKYISDQKEGYKLISISAPQVTYLFFEPAKSEDPSGKIPYKISKEQRVLILNEIDRLFGNDLARYRLDKEDKTGSYNAILFAIDAIYKNLAPETYE